MDTDAVLKLLQDVADEYINPRFQSLADEHVTEKGPGDLVTVADREAEVAISEALHSAYPNAVILGEEASAADGSILGRYQSADHAFTIDPIDGTKNFVHGSPDHAVMVAELQAGECVRSWIWQPQHQRGYVAEKGAGTWRDGARLYCTPVATAPDAIRAVTSMRPWLGERIGDIPPLELTWVCCGLDYPRLIEGAADIILYGGTYPWDHAPGTLMVSEAGGYVGTFEGATYDPREEPSGIIVTGDRSAYDLVLPQLSGLPSR
ncbi:MAG: inositol monophosphatase [Ornithinimicrobium sp.]